MKTLLKRPKGYRQIIVEGEIWYWTTSNTFNPLVARHAMTRAKIAADHATVDRLAAIHGFCGYDDRRECPIYGPGLVAAWIKEAIHWIPAP